MTTNQTADLEALKRMRDRAAAASPIADVVRLSVTSTDAIIATLERAERIEKAAGDQGTGKLRNADFWRHHEDCDPLRTGCVCGLSEFRTALSAGAGVGS